jgi:hypothetical protein
MGKSSFEKITQSQKVLYGPRRILLCGFDSKGQNMFETVLGMAGLSEVSRVWVSSDQKKTTVSDLLEVADGSGAGAVSELPRAVIVSGLTEAQLISLMTACKKSGMQQALWAVLTPVSKTWTVDQLLAELARERGAMQGRNTR